MRTILFIQTACTERRFFILRQIFLVCLFFFLSHIPPAKAEMFIDEMGRSLDLDIPPSRIISLAPHITEILFALGLEEQVVGVTRYSDYPEAARQKERIGSYVRLNIEKIVSLEPDLVISTAGGNPREAVDRLAKLGIKVFVIHPKKIEDIYTNIRSIGAITGRKKEGSAMAARLEKRVKDIVSRLEGLSRPKVFFQLGASPLYTAGSKTFVDDLLRKAGGENIAGREKIRYPVYSMEEVISRQPEVIFAMPHGSERNVDANAYWKKWSIIPAVKNGRVFQVDPSIVNRPSPRIAEGLEIVARTLHPEAFINE